MREELDKQLCEKYPKLFADRNSPMTETAMCWGFDVGDGWYDLIEILCGSIQGYIDSNNIPQITVSQVKEKFGSLRFYTNGSDDLITGMVWMAEHMSCRVCETCGKPGKFRGKGWFYTACDEHAREE